MFVRRYKAGENKQSMLIKRGDVAEKVIMLSYEMSYFVSTLNQKQIMSYWNILKSAEFNRFSQKFRQICFHYCPNCKQINCLRRKVEKF